MTTTDQDPREAARQQIAEGLRLVGEGIAAVLATLEAGRQKPEEEPMTVAEAAALLKVDKRSVYRFVAKNPAVGLRVGSRLRVEKHALLRAMRRG